MAVWLVPLSLFMLLSTASRACDGSGFTIDGLVDNGDGTYTITVTVTIAGADWGGGIFGGTRGFLFGTDVPIISVTPPSFTSFNGTTLPAVIAGANVNWGNPVGGPFFVADTEPTQSFTFTIVVSGRPTSWTGSGQELNRCTYTGIFPCPLPVITPLQGDQFVCEGLPVSLAVDVVGASSIVWSNGASGTTITDLPTTTTTYSVTAINECGSTTEDFTVFINPLPTLIPNFTETDICVGDSVILEVFPEFVTDIQWNPPVGNSPAIQVSPDVPSTYTVIGSNDCGLVELTFVVNVLPLPFVAALNDLSSICPGESVDLEAFVDQEEIIFWSSGTSTSDTYTVSPTTTTDYTIFAGNFCGL
ncbi:MAG: hypothetical protein AAGA62_08990, partial [Bacteroidota bacterium]